MEVTGYILPGSFYALKKIPGTTIEVFPVKIFGNGFLVRIFLNRNDWVLGRAFYIAETNKSYLCWNNKESKIRLLHSGSWISIQNIKVKERVS